MYQYETSRLHRFLSVNKRKLFIHELRVIWALLPCWHTYVENTFSSNNIQPKLQHIISLHVPSKCLGIL